MDQDLRTAIHLSILDLEILVINRARRLLRSRRLKKAAFMEVQDNVMSLVLPYWAKFVFEGHGRINPRQGKYMVWFANPQDDPRLPADGIVWRDSDRRALTSGEYRFAQQMNAERRATGGTPYMYFQKSLPPRAGHDDLSPLREELPSLVKDAVTPRIRKVVAERIRRALEG